MPIATTITVTTAELRKGDSIVSGPTRTLHFGIVQAVSLRAKRATVTVRDANTHEDRKGDCDRTATFIIEREVETEEERQAEMDEFLSMSLRKSRESAKAALEAAQDKMAKALPTGRVSHWEIQTLVEAQAMEELWDRVDTIEERVTEGTIEPLSYVEIVEKVRERCREDLLSFRASSRSTSTMSNAVEDAQMEAKRQFLSRWL